MNSFNVIWQDFNKRSFEPYDIMPHLVECYNEVEHKPVTIDEFKEFVINVSRSRWKSRCEYEVIVSGWPNTKTFEKWDIHKQIMMNLDRVVETLILNVLDD